MQSSFSISAVSRRGLDCVALLLAMTVSASCVRADDDSPAKTEHAALHVTRVANIAYCHRDDRDLTADIYVPDGIGPFPGVLMVHGGGWVSGGKWQMDGFAQPLAEAGYTVVSIEYRLAPRYKFPAPLEDCRDAVVWMRRHAPDYKIDPSRIAGYGYSAGAHLVCLLGLRANSDPGGDSAGNRYAAARLQAVVAGGTPCDFTSVPENSRIYSLFLGGTRAEKPDAYREASPASFASAKDPPVWFYHGTNDRLVSLADAEALHEKLTKLGVHSEMYLVADKGHIGTFFDRTAPRKAIHFLDQILK